MVEKKCIMKKTMAELLLIQMIKKNNVNKKIRFPSLIIIIRCVFQNDRKLCPQIYLDECLYEL